MALSLINFSIFLSALSMSINFVTGASYETILLESGKVCDINFKSVELTLNAGTQAILVAEEGFFSSWTGRYNFHCKFSVKVRSKDGFNGIYAVIQDLNFRRNATSNDCIDYVAFRKGAPKFFPSDTLKKFCGLVRSGSSEVDIHKHEVNHKYKLQRASNAFVVDGTVLEVDIFVSNLRLSVNDRLIVSVLFTAYSDTGCDIDDMLECKNDECISYSFKNDGLRNCPYLTCEDEDECPQYVSIDETKIVGNPKSTGIGNKVTVGALVSIFLVLILFSACIYVCKRAERLCWAPPPPRRPPPQPSAEVERVLPSAPPEPGVKDLPPSYDSLFPSQSS